ncbi:COR domain-containing protein [Rheinheimera sp. SA_1]|uniref:COR domain-containing protein n=1 Tax=Rheinheimera sp. SA_1 TaxID=1827365 RepID=UPI0018D45830|nr:COR domain-containing protein [Rheinheimera sp. SA_1]
MLTELRVSGCQALTSITAFEKLAALTRLDIRQCNALTSLSGIEKLSSLTSLDLSGNEALMSLAGIENLSKLTSLELNGNEALTSLSEIEKLSTLTSLDLSDNAVLTSLSGIEKLTSLTWLNLSRNEALTDLSGIEQLTGLRWLLLGGVNLTLPIQLAELLMLSVARLRVHAFGGLAIEHVPPELTRNFNQTAFEDWLHACQTQGFAPARQLKVMLLGNGRIGKTQLARRLRGEGFDESVHSTHGIQLHSVSWQQLFQDKLAVEPSDADLQLHCWDFGGQDVYLGTHSLFLDEQAVYLLLWHPDSENTKFVDCEALKIRNRPLSYWLAYLKSLVGDKANILVCQSQCDSPDQHCNAQVPNPPPFKALRQLDISSKSPDGLEQFYPAFKHALKQQLNSNNDIWLPSSWLAVEHEIRQRITLQPSLKQLPFAEFVSLCEQHQVAASATLANYLHQSGVLFFRDGHFNNQLILDQQWALQGVYLLLEREQVLPELKDNNGKFSKNTLQRWVRQQQLNIADLPLYLEMMQQCGACFEVSDSTYIAPDNLPEFDEARAAQIWHHSTADIEIKLSYTFLHDATMRYLLSKIGAIAKQHAYYWRYGCCFYQQRHQCKVWFDCALLPQTAEHQQNYSQPGEITLRLAGQNAVDLAEHLVDSITEASHLGQLPVVHWLTGQPTNQRDEQQDRKPAEPFAQLGPAAPPPATPAIYFSYAWGDERDSRQLASNTLYRSLSDTYGEGNVYRDQQKMRPGDSIAAFEREIARGHFVLLVLSQKYLFDSLHCMKELALLYESVQRQQLAFCDKVIPVVLADVQIDKPVDRLKIVRHWQQKRAELDELITEVGAEAAGKSSVDELEHLRAIENSCANALAWISDLVSERQAKLQVEATLQLVTRKVADSLKQH